MLYDPQRAAILASKSELYNLNEWLIGINIYSKAWLEFSEGNDV